METTTTGSHPRSGTTARRDTARPERYERPGPARRLAMRAGLALLLWSRRTAPRVTDEELRLLDAARREAERDYDALRAATGARVLPLR